MGRPIPQMVQLPEHLFVTLGEWACQQGARDLVKQPGCWEREAGAGWWVALNPHQESCECSRGAEVPPVAWYVEFNGWPAGVVDVQGWSMAAGSVANEVSFRLALAEASKPRGAKR